MTAARGVDGLRSRDAPSSEAEAAVLDAARRMLERVPLSELSVSRLIREAGISRATFYFYFSSKFAVLAVLVGRLIEELKLAFAGAVAGIDLERSLDDRLRAAAELWGQNRSLLGAIAENWHGVPELQVLWLELIDRLTDLVMAEALAARQPTDAHLVRPQAAAVAWATERYLYLSGLRLYPELYDEDAALLAIKQMWLGVVLGLRAVDDHA